MIADLYRDDYPEVTPSAGPTSSACWPRRSGVRPDAAQGSGRDAEAGPQRPAVDGSALFELHDTFGMPVELAVEEARRTGILLSPTWQAEYDALMAEQRARSHEARAAVDPTTV